MYLAQQPPPDITFSSSVRVVNLLATVRSARGEIVTDLALGDFQLAENGRPQQIRYFSKQSELPLTIGLLIDTSYSQEKVLEAERTASIAFLDEILRPDRDKVFIYQFDTEIRTASMLTSSLEKLGEALTYVALPTRRQLEASRTGAGTLLYDAVETASEFVMARLEGRKALIVLSDGVDVGSTGSLPVAVDACQRADTLVYGIHFGDSGGKRVLARMAQETGGALFEITKKTPVDSVYRAIQEELRSQYSIGYVPDVPVKTAEFRKLQLAVRRPGLKVQARDRYWAALR